MGRQIFIDTVPPIPLLTSLVKGEERVGVISSGVISAHGPNQQVPSPSRGGSGWGWGSTACASAPFPSWPRPWRASNSSV